VPFAGVALLAGALSVLAPCVVGLLPILIGRSVAPGSRAHSAILVIAGLCASIFVFTMLFRATTLLVDVPQRVWQYVAGAILAGFGVVSLLPQVWEWVSARVRLAEVGDRGARFGIGRQSRVGDLVLGASLGPAFSACSPTYALIVAVILPVSPAEGAAYLAAYLAGLAAMMAVIVIGGRRAVTALGWGVNPHGWFRRVLGVFFILFGVAIATGLDKEVLSFVVQNGWFDWQLQFEDTVR
jgi:cytochrome c biogenesis protein CcdA